jgi:excisionase family DNA binding protein
MHDDKKILTTKEAAERLRISERTLDRLCEADSGLKKIRLSPRRVGLLEANVDAYVDRLGAAA